MATVFPHLLEHNPRPHPPRARFPGRSLHQSQPPSWRTTRRFPTRRFPTFIGPNPAPSTPSSTPKSRTRFPPQPTLSSTLFWTKPVPSGSPFPQNKAYLGGALKSIKSQLLSNFTKYPAPSTRVARHHPDGRDLSIKRNSMKAIARGQTDLDRSVPEFPATLHWTKRQVRLFARPQSAFGRLVLKETNR